jgi:hypothetical protein
MAYYDLTILVTITTMNMVEEMCCGYGTISNHCCEKTAQCLQQTSEKVSAASKCDYSISQISRHPECTSITAGAFSRI